MPSPAPHPLFWGKCDHPGKLPPSQSFLSLSIHSPGPPQLDASKRESKWRPLKSKGHRIIEFGISFLASVPSHYPPQPASVAPSLSKCKVSAHRAVLSRKFSLCLKKFASSLLMNRKSASETAVKSCCVKTEINNLLSKGSQWVWIYQLRFLK